VESIASYLTTRDAKQVLDLIWYGLGLEWNGAQTEA
jgi:hypothetical protein